MNDNEKIRFTTCSGPSMYPTIRPGDGIELFTGRDAAESCRAGDIIVFPHHFAAMDVVHRIIKITPDGMITRGDNNNRFDPKVIRFEDMAGKVVAIKRGSRLITVKGGTYGLLIHKIMLLRKYFMLYGLRPLRFLSRVIAASGVLTVFHPFVKTKVIYFKRNDRTIVTLWVGNRTVGTQQPDSGRWEIRFPYKYFIDTDRLEIKR